MNSMNFIVGMFLDDNKGLDKETCKKIMNHIDSMEEFLKKLKTNMETFEERIKNQLTLPLIYLNKLRDSLDEENKTKLDKCISSLEKINTQLEENSAQRQK